MAEAPDPDEVVALLDEAAHAAGTALSAYLRTSSGRTELRARGGRPGQYRLDLTADRAVLDVLAGSGLGVLSEESGLTGVEEDTDASAPGEDGAAAGERAVAGSGVVVVVDPVDGSTNASRGFPWYACSLCAVDSQGPWVALVVNLATGVRYSAVRGRGAFRAERGAQPEGIATSGTEALRDSLVLLNGHPPAHLGWRQYRSLGATALDLCAVADGSADATIDCTRDALGPWDYMAAMLVLTEAGGVIRDVWDRELVVLDHDARRTPVAAATPALLRRAMGARGMG